MGLTSRSLLLLVGLPAGIAKLAQKRDHSRADLQTEQTTTPLGDYSWMHAALPITSSLQIAFRQWESAVQNAVWNVDSEGAFHSQPAITVPEIIIRNKNESCLSCQCSFINRLSLPANCDIEANSRLMAVKWIPSDATVLEVGARYGSVSCAISRALRESGKQVSMDADERVWAALERNRANLKCNFHVAKGLLGEHDGKIFENRYGTLASTNASFSGNVVATVPHFTVDDLERTHNLRFDTANFDCEGCFAPVVSTFPSFFDRLKLLIIEVHDEPEAQAVAQLQKRGWKLRGIHSRQRVLENLHAQGKGNLRKASA